MADASEAWSLESLAAETSEGMELQVQGLRKSFTEDVVLRDVSFSVDAGEFCVVTGPSGCGKTTLLNCIADLEQQEGGQVYIGGSDIGRQSINERNLGYVFQEFDRVLFPHMTVRENIEFGLLLADIDPAERDKRINNLASTVAIRNVLDDYPSELSGGQKQRVEFCRNIVNSSGLILFDDPFSNLDYKLKKKMETEIRRLSEEIGTTFVFVTHDQQMALELPDKLVVLNEGIVEQVGAPMDVYQNPDSAFVAAYLGHSNLFFGEISKIKDERVDIKCDSGTFTVAIDSNQMNTRDLESGDRSAFSVRPERLAVGTSEEMSEYDNTMPVRVVEIINQGNQIEYLLEDETGNLLVQLTNEEQPRHLPESAVAGWDTDVGLLETPSAAPGWDWEDVRSL